MYASFTQHTFPASWINVIYHGEMMKFPTSSIVNELNTICEPADVWKWSPRAMKSTSASQKTAHFAMWLDSLSSQMKVINFDRPRTRTYTILHVDYRFAILF